MRKKSQPRYGSWTVTISLAAATVLYLLVSFFPTARAIKSLRDEIRNDESYITHATSLTIALAQNQSELERTREYTTSSRQRLPTHGTFSALLGRITKQADVAGAGTTRIEPQPEVELDTLRVVPVVFAAKGSFVEICRLLAGLEGLPERMWLDDVRFEALRETGQKMKCEMRLVVFAGKSENSD
ncbi:MAG TPA: type 4a pilus biogenesis protein PilO [Pirellulales bacterium]|jgi:Tfp pilus assembly protein PilO|nr:type 4a pilus biogenesis protein PilO [Pirellulales bacterium]